ncbi:hypothetical protein R3P38DRAFT_2824912 [Favolaschia claudopus]|uniref:Uncharacterized protein n=1 Tax=Favolaschia claudopus TaxID=2862362 RepID=A0AAW0EID5_9AGAR
MANEDTHTASLPQLNPGNVSHDVPDNATDASSTSSRPVVPDAVPVSIPLAEPNPVAPIRSTLVPLGSQAHSTTAASHPKKFSAVNINKKFLEKNSTSSSSPASASANSAASKAGGSVARPQTQTATSHSRLVTTKLTAAPQSLSAGSGWSRPSSATPPATNAANGVTASSMPGPGEPPPSSTGSQLPHPSSVIQPQSRPMTSRGAGSREGSYSAGGGVGKPVWGNASKSNQRLDMTSQSDFPTAAEVAAAPRKSKPSLADRNDAARQATAKELAAAAANKQARMEEADTFRGVHLDPNAHHWDDMEEDDDNFLDGVLDFGDGRQYKIETADLPTNLSSTNFAAPDSSSALSSRSASRLDRDEAQQLNEPVSKEERFADDFDRSWPRSRASPSLSIRDLPGAPALSTHSSSSNAAPSPISPSISMTSDTASRTLLFNERSNKLEPYNRTAGGSGGTGIQRRGSDNSFPAADPRSGRDHFASGQPQLLQNRGRGFNNIAERGPPQSQGRRDGIPGSGPPPPLQSSRGPPNNAWTQRKESEGAESQGKRLSTMGPPPVPPQTGPIGAGGRQRPPHMPMMSSEADGLPVRPNRRPSNSRESRPLPPATPPNTTAPEPSPRRAPSQSPALSHASVVPESPVAPVVLPPPVDIDEMRKDVMQSAAARAKARRQQEEEEREREKERARRKAAEIEEKMAADATSAKHEEELAAAAARAQQDALDFIESAVKTVEVKQPFASTSQPAASTTIPVQQPIKPPLRRPSIMDSSLSSHASVESRPGPPLRISSSGFSGPPVPPPLTTSGSWRTKPSPISATVPATSTPRGIQEEQQQQLHQPPRPPIATFVSPPSALDQVESLAENAEERDELEVVDYSDLGKFIGVADGQESTPTPQPPPAKDKPFAATSAPVVPVRPSRPSAADFFDDRPPRSPEVEKTNVSSWRRQSIQQDYEPLSQTQAESGKERARNDMPLHASNAVPATPAKDAASAAPTVSPVVPHGLSPHSNRTPRSQPFYKEATLSTLDDVMSRIKGAIDVMQSSERDHRTSEVPSTSSPLRPFQPSQTVNVSTAKERWVPAFRSRPPFEVEPQEVIITGCEPPRSPKPAWNTFAVRLPKVSQPLEPVNRKQMLLCARSAVVRWDVLSFDPPVEGMSRKEFTVNEVLFRKTAFKGKSKYKVLIPDRSAGAPRVHIPMSPRAVNGAVPFGRPPAPADSLTSWRRQAPAYSAESEAGLSTMSRSPPPEVPSDPNVASIPRPDALPSSKSEDVFGPVRPRSQPKMPVGSAVGFYRDSRIDVAEPDTTPAVNFFVNSELENPTRSGAEHSKAKPSILVSSPAASSALGPGDLLTSKHFTSIASGLKPSPTSSPEIGIPTLMGNNKTESKSSDDSTDRTPITPPSHHTASWARSSLNLSLKDSPLRGPDPEHLKAVWSQTSNNGGLHAVNSLEGIADDLTAIPFTLQDVKSEDGGTPPPPTTAPSRMSLTDVTRAFQQVPSSSSSSLRPTISPPSTTAPVARPTPAPAAAAAAYSYSLPPPPSQMMRPNYAQYSPMMSSPTTPMMYPMAPSPVPARMSVNGMAVNGHPTLYGQPVWMAPPQNPMNGAMMRPVASPYPQMMTYPAPASSQMYAPQQPQPMQNPSQANPNAPRGRGMPMMSPALQHQNAMYPGSPILMHSPAMPVGYMNLQPPPGARGQTGNHNGHPQMPPQQQHQPQQQPIPQHQPNGHPMQHTTGYNPVPSASFMRPTW